MELRMSRTYRTRSRRVLSVIGQDGDRWLVKDLADGTTSTKSATELDIVAEVPALAFVPKFVAADGTTIEFFAISDTPGFTHRVVINGAARDWLGHGKPSAKAAEFFHTKHIASRSAGAATVPQPTSESAP